jgi:hypothetical protein
MTDARRWETLRAIGAELAHEHGHSCPDVVEAVTDAAGHFSTATAAEPEAEAVHVFLTGLAAALG